MYHPERFNETLGEKGRGFHEFTHAIYPYFYHIDPVRYLKSRHGFIDPELLKVSTDIDTS